LEKNDYPSLSGFALIVVIVDRCIVERSVERIGKISALFHRSQLIHSRLVGFITAATASIRFLNSPISRAFIAGLQVEFSSAARLRSFCDIFL
jgi:hypothetical protein